MLPPLCLAFVNPLGVKASLLYKEIQTQAAKLGYKSYVVKVGSLLEKTQVSLSHIPFHLQSIFCGNQLCQQTGRPDCIGILALHKIAALWKPGHFIVVQSLKRIAEVELFQKIFQGQFFLVGLSQSYPVREQNLLKKFKKGDSTEHRQWAKEAMHHDEWGGLHNPYGQHVQKVFSKADLFFNIDDLASLSLIFQRFLRALFSHPFVFPSVDEVAMMHAYTEKLRSGDNSRPVGAALVDANHRLLSVGYNDVPKSGGGVYTGEESVDGRDWVMNLNTNFQAKKELFHEVLKLLEKSCGANLAAAYEEGFIRTLKSETRFMDILEYSRNIHGEMNVITQAARHGLSTQNARLYTTTFPCHGCAKHIIAAGIQEVIYSDPFAKSRAPQFFQDSMTVGGKPTPPKVHFRPYSGISPLKYSLFTAPLRENDMGEKLEWKPLFKGNIQPDAIVLEKIKAVLEEAPFLVPYKAK